MDVKNNRRGHRCLPGAGGRGGSGGPVSRPLGCCSPAPHLVSQRPRGNSPSLLGPLATLHPSAATVQAQTLTASLSPGQRPIPHPTRESLFRQIYQLSWPGNFFILKGPRNQKASVFQKLPCDFFGLELCSRLEYLMLRLF